MSDLHREPTEQGAPAPHGGPPGQAPAVPQSEIQAASGPSGPRAGFWQRFGAVLIDVLVLLVPSVLITVALDNSGLAQALTTLLGLAYYTVLEGGPTGQTVGKRALGIRVFDFRGGAGPIGYPRALLRQIVKYISAIPLFLGYLWMLWDREKQTWQDKAAGSVVVPVDAYPVQK